MVGEEMLHTRHYILHLSLLDCIIFHIYVPVMCELMESCMEYVTKKESYERRGEDDELKDNERDDSTVVESKKKGRKRKMQR